MRCTAILYQTPLDCNWRGLRAIDFLGFGAAKLINKLPERINQIQGRKNMIDQRLWKLMQTKLGYNNEEATMFRNDPRNEQVLSKAEELFKRHFVAEVIEAHGCNSRHKKGDKIHLDGYGNLLKEGNPAKICIFALAALSPLFFASQELMYAGIEPNQMCFRSASCIDVGLKCGGWGRIVMQLSSEKKEPN